MTAAIATHQLSKDYTFHRQRPGLSGALVGLFSRQRETRRALDAFDLLIEPGELVGLLGRNGAGKTTTVKLCCGLLRPSAGSVEVLGFEPWKREFAFLRRIAVVLGQKSMLWWDVSAMDSYLVHRAMYDLEPGFFARRVSELAELLSIESLLDVPVRKLSLGERMKAELLAALLHGPDVLFLDEPTIGLDVISRLAVRDFLREINQTHGTTIVLTSHDMGDVEALCERVLLVDHGRLSYDGTLVDLVRSTRPAKQLTLIYERPPGLPDRLPPGVDVHYDGGVRVELSVRRDLVTWLLREVPTWGELADVDVAEADLDDVMRTVLATDPEGPR
jgi:ABC-2 type transport system ATP-binding protein